MRETRDITIQDGSTSKTFRIKQMDVLTQHDFVVKLGIALAETEGADAPIIGDDIASIGIAILQKLEQKGLAAFRGLSYNKTKELTEMLRSCITRVVDKYEQQIMPDTIEQLSTLFELEKAAVNINFFTQGWSTGENSESQPSIVVGKGAPENAKQ